MNLKEALKISTLPAIVASLCCLSPVILVALGLSSVSFATSLADTLYGDYKWAFRLVGLLALVVAILMYLRRQKNICTLDDVKRHRNEIVNLVALSVTLAVLGYLFFLYVVVEYAGIFLGIWK